MSTQIWSSKMAGKVKTGVTGWKPSQPLNVVVDLSHYNNINLTLAKQAGVAGVIHKATQGLTFKDPLWGTRFNQARELGLYFGSYHFGTGDGTGEEQARAFLDVVSPAFPSLLVLDLEQNTQGPTMSLQQARDFVSEIHELTGRWPTVYGGSFLRGALQNLNPEDSSADLLFGCQLWLADYRAEPEPISGWDNWTLWQYTDAEHGNPPHDVAGIRECDRDIFNGTEEELQRFFEG